MFKNYSRMDRKRFKFVALMLLFPILQFLVFYVYINFDSFVLAFTNIRGEFTLENFEEIWAEIQKPSRLPLTESIIRSVITWAIHIFVLFPVNILFSYALFKKVWGHKIFRVLFFLPGIIGSVVMTTLFRYLLDGPVSELLYHFGMISEEMYQSGFFFGEISFKMVLIYYIWINLGANIVVLTGALTRIPESVLESGRLDGVGFFQEFFQIALPLIWPSVSTLLIFQLGSIFTADGGTFLLTGLSNADASTGGYYIFNYVYAMTNSGNVSGAHYPSAVGLLITVFTMPFVLIVRHFIEKHTDNIEY